MTETKTLARPYAKAVFQTAIEHEKVAQWALLLKDLAEISKDKSFRFILNERKISDNEMLKLLAEICGDKFDNQAENFIKILFAENRLIILPEICELFLEQKADHEKTATVIMKSFKPLTAEIKQQFIDALQQRLQRTVELIVEIDSSLLGGAVLQAGDLVIDRSVKSSLEQLHRKLSS